MKTPTLKWIDPCLKESLGKRVELRLRPSVFTLRITVVLASALPALALASFSTWAFTKFDPGLLNVVLWAFGFVFLAAATEVQDKRLALVTGISGATIVASALLGYGFAAEIALLGSWIVAAWTVPIVLAVISRALVSTANSR